MSVDEAGLRVLTRAECIRRLGLVAVGRVALSWRAMPTILPVHFALTDDDSVVFEARLDSTLYRATDGTVVAFEAEGPAGAVEPTWTVVAQGLATHRRSAWPSAGPFHTERVELALAEVSGREVLDASSQIAPMVTNGLPRW